MLHLYVASFHNFAPCAVFYQHRRRPRVLPAQNLSLWNQLSMAEHVFRRLGGEFRYKNIFLLGKAIKWHSCSSHYKSNRGQLPCPTICLNKLAWLFVSQVPFDPCLILPALVTECFTFHCERSKTIRKFPNQETNKIPLDWM